MGKKKIDYSKLPEYRIVVKPDDLETGVQMISIVDEPAIEIKGYAFAPQDFDIVTPPCHQTWDGTDNCQCIIIDGEWTTGDNPCEFCLENKEAWEALNLNFKQHKFSANEEQKIIVGPALVPELRIFRNGKEDGSGPHLIYFTAEDIKLIVKKFNRGNNNRSIDVSHSGVSVNAYIMENWLVADPVFDKSKLYGYNLPKDTWFMAMQIEDDLFWQEQVKDLGKFSFSVQAKLGQTLTKFATNYVEFSRQTLKILSLDELIGFAEYEIELLKR